MWNLKKQLSISRRGIHFLWIYSLHLVLCVPECVMYVSVYACSHVGTGRAEADIRSLLSLSTICAESGSFTWTPSAPAQVVPSLPSECWNYRQATASIYAVELRSAPHVCTAGPLPTEPSPRPWYTLVLAVVSIWVACQGMINLGG